jgi:hypothetical protein
MSAALVQKLLQRSRDNAQMLAAVTGVAGVFGVAVYKLANIAAEVRNEKQLREYAIKAERDLREQTVAAVLAKAQKDIVVAQKETAERFLMYGYAAEFERFQQRAQGPGQ